MTDKEIYIFFIFVPYVARGAEKANEICTVIDLYIHNVGFSI